MTTLTPELARMQLDRTAGTLESEAKLLYLYIRDFAQQLEAPQSPAAGRTMMRIHTLSHSMAPMLKDVRRYTTFLLATAKNSRGVRKGRS